MRTVSTVLALVLFGSASGADPVPTFKVENKTFVVVNKIPAPEKPQTVPGVAPRPGEPVKVTPGVVINRPFSEPMPGTIVLDRYGTVASTSGVVWSSPQFTTSIPAPTRTGRVLYAAPNGLTRTLPAQACVGFA